MTTVAAALFAACISERELQDSVMEHAMVRGWRCMHQRPARTATGWRTATSGQGKGFPDVLALRRDRSLVVELKRVGARPDAEQVAWLEAFREAGWEVYVWTPADGDEIMAVLA